MSELHNEIWLQSLITAPIEESTSLEYKAAPALQNNKEIRKDVSAMANSSGGIIIYGLKEKKDANGNNIPDALDDVSTTHVTKETLEQIILAIQPPLVEFKIEKVETPSLGSSAHVLVVIKKRRPFRARDFFFIRTQGSVRLGGLHPGLLTHRPFRTKK